MSQQYTPALKKINTIISSMKSLGICEKKPEFLSNHPDHIKVLRKVAYQMLYFLNRDVALSGVHKESLFDISFAMILEIHSLAEEDRRIMNLKIVDNGKEVNFLEHMDKFLLISSQSIKF